MKRLTALFLLLMSAVGACAQPATKKDDTTVRALAFPGGEGQLATSPAVRVARPGVLVVAPPAQLKQRAMEMAAHGYVAYAISAIPGERDAVARRATAALEVLGKQPLVSPHKYVAIGYGAGGTAVLDLARGGADLLGVAAVGPDLTPAPNGQQKISSRVLVLGGGDDPGMTFARLAAFETEMKAAQADWDFVRYGSVGSDFCDPQSKSYDADAAQRTGTALRQFLFDVLPTAPRSFGTSEPAEPAAPAGIPDKVLKVLKHVDDNDRAPDGYEGGRNFGNFERRLPANDRNGRRLRYREWDVNPLRPGVNRGAERLVTGSDGSAYYTSDHYETFKKIR
ncbi:MAG: dienelactone hydrolase family protein [Gemmataceae bacterium]|nr:dienelactone hydrolase family protein [Gemmataceae bacterium]